MKKSRKNEIGMIGRSKADMKKGRREKRSVKEKKGETKTIKGESEQGFHFKTVQENMQKRMAKK